MTQRDDRGMTLIELLITMAITVLIMSVIASSLILGLKSTKQASNHLLDSRDAQAISAYLPTDLQSVQADQIETSPATPTGCAGSPSEPYNVVRLTWFETTADGTTWYRATYRVVSTGSDWLLVRYACSAPSETALASAAATTQPLVRNLRPASDGLPSVTPTGQGLTITVTDASGYSFSITGTRRTVIAASAPVTPPPTTPPPALPEVKAAEMFDDDIDGRVERVLLTFSANVPSGCGPSLFTLENVPSGGTRGAVTVNGEKVTIAVAQTSSATPDTAVGTFRVRFTPDAGCEAIAFDGPPTDKAAPVLVGLQVLPAGTPNPTSGKAEPGDGFVATFSEPVTGVGSSGTVVLGNANGNPKNNTLLLSAISGTAVNLGTDTYMTATNLSAATFAATVTSSADGAAYTVLMGACDASRQNNSCGNLTPGPAAAATALVPNGAIKDAADNSVKPLTTSPVPTGSFRAF